MKKSLVVVFTLLISTAIAATLWWYGSKTEQSGRTTYHVVLDNVLRMLGCAILASM
jgi:hypothetical protein